MIARHKYRARPVTIDGIRFASKAEGKRYTELKLLERAGEIKALELQPRYPLNVQGTKVGEYRADFTYVETRTGKRVIEDVKGMRTPLYSWKRKHFEIQYGTEITERAA